MDRAGLIALILGEKLYDYQHQWIAKGEGSKIDRLWIKGRQIGGSTSTMAEYLADSILNDGQFRVVTSRNKRKAKDLIIKGRKMLRAAFPKATLDKILTGHPSTEKIEFANGSEIRAISKDPDDARSDTITRFLWDETAFHDQPALLLTALEGALLRGGALDMVTTFNGVGDLTHTRYVAWKDNPADNQYLQINPSTDCPDITPTKIARMEHNLRELGLNPDQELYCIPVRQSGSVFSWDLMQTALCMDAPTLGGSTWISWDPAKSSDGSGVSAIRSKDGVYEITELKDLARQPYPKQLDWVLSLRSQLSADGIYIESYTQGDVLVDFAEAYAKPVKISKVERIAAARSIRYYIESGRFKISRTLELAPKLIDEFLSFDGESGDWTHRGGGHGDLASSVMNFWYKRVMSETRTSISDISHIVRPPIETMRTRSGLSLISRR